MREIKFRAWSYGMEKYNIQPQMVSGRNLMWRDGEFISGVWNNEDTDIAEECEIELMQYTGLKDKNGVEIYEGDIVKYKGNSLLREVEMIKGSWSIRSLNTIYKMYGDEIFLEYEIIGNIYQNPELLSDI